MRQTTGPAQSAYFDDPRRRIELAGVLNLRDVGGYPVAGGRAVRWRTLLRSDALHLLDAPGLAAVAGLGLRTVLDLRSNAEVETAPSPLRGRVRHRPLLADLTALPAPAIPQSPGDGLDLAAIYDYFVAECGAAIAIAVNDLSADDALPALVHCTAGKDRTGVVVALVLAVLGVPDEVIAADYALSAGYLNAVPAPATGHRPAGTDPSDQLTTVLLRSPPELILDVLATIRERAGSVDGYLRGHGLTDAALGRLRSALIV